MTATNKIGYPVPAGTSLAAPESPQAQPDPNVPPAPSQDVPDQHWNGVAFVPNVDTNSEFTQQAPGVKVPEGRGFRHG